VTAAGLCAAASIAICVLAATGTGCRWYYQAFYASGLLDTDRFRSAAREGLAEAGGEVADRDWDAATVVLRAWGNGLPMRRTDGRTDRPCDYVVEVSLPWDRTGAPAAAVYVHPVTRKIVGIG